MDSLLIEPTPNSPLVYFQPNGKLLMEGRAIPENVSKIFDPLLLYISKLSVPDVYFDINLEYFNTSASKKILEILRNINGNKHVQTCVVNWHYESDDDDSLDMVEIFRDCLSGIEFKIIEHDDIVSLYDQLKPEN
jgi:hypothetical protein